MTSYRVQGLLAIGSSALALAACGTPDLNTDLRPDGDPEVLTVMVQTDQLSAFGGVPEERATFCKTGDDKVPTVVGLPDFSIAQVCPDDHSMGVDEVADADPLAWLARVEFDELLDPSIETLVNMDGGPCGPTDDGCVGHISAANPFTLTCAGAPVAYDGYYVPNGNNVSWPVGPNLTLIPSDYTVIPTGSECSLMINDNVVDKDGNSVPADQRGPYKFKVQVLQIAGCPDPGTDASGCTITPGDGETAVATDATIDITFNAAIDAASAGASAITLHDDTANTDIAFTASAAGPDLTLTPDAALPAGDSFTLTIHSADQFCDLAGGCMTPGADIVIGFST
jgi:hypothetical protein